MFESSHIVQEVDDVYFSVAETVPVLLMRQGEMLKIIRQVDANWYEGRSESGRTGIFPVSYVQTLLEPLSVVTPCPSPLPPGYCRQAGLQSVTDELICHKKHFQDTDTVAMGRPDGE